MLFCFASFFIIWNRKSSSQGEGFFTRCLSIAFTMFAHVSERDFFSPICSNFGVECDGKSEISQSVQNVFFFEKIEYFSKKYFSKKT